MSKLTVLHQGDVMVNSLYSNKLLNACHIFEK